MNAKYKTIIIITGAVFLTGVLILASLTGCNDKRAAVTASEIGKDTVCPVTGERFKITKFSPVVEYQGKAYYFCCPGCDKKFLADPQQYLIETAAASSDTTDGHGAIPEIGDTILYWTCSMHPTVRSDESGDCPICGMDMIPVRKKDQSSINVDEKTASLLSIEKASARVRELTMHLLLPGRVANDQDLFVAQQEYLSAASVPGDLSRSARVKLLLMGMNESQIIQLKERGAPDEALITPSGGRAWIYAQVYEPDIAYVRSGQDVEISMPAYPGIDFNGVIASISPTLDPETRSVTARIRIINRRRELQLGMYADVHVMVNIGPVLTVPYSSVINTGRRSLVYQETEPGRFAPRPVVAGAVTDEWIEIKSGIKEGDQVVAAGNFLLDSQSTLAGGQSLVYGNAADINGKAPTSTAPVHQH